MSEPPDRSRAENMEQLSGLARGPKGDKGDQGDQGKRGDLSRPLRRALVYLFATAAGLALVALLIGFREIHDIRAQAAQNIAAQHREQAAQQRAARALEAKLCFSLDRLKRWSPPAGNPKTNPSRASLQQLRRDLAPLGADVGCR